MLRHESGVLLSVVNELRLHLTLGERDFNESVSLEQI